MRQMITRFILLHLGVSACLFMNAQVSANYTFSSQNNVYEPLVMANVLVSGNFDDAQYAVDGLPAFVFAGQSYTSLSVNTNGYLVLGSTNNSISNYSPISTSSSVAGVVAPFGRDLQSAGSSSSINWALLGDDIVVEWNDVKRFGQSAESFDFQVRWSLTNGTIRFIYGEMLNIMAATNAPQVGLRGASTADFLNRSVTANETWETSTPGALSNATCRFTSSAPASWPSLGLTFVFSSCEGIMGCMDGSACNYDVNATCDSGGCVYCGCVESNCGCMNEMACNFDPQATYDNGGCDFSCFGCMDNNALNFDAGATQADSSCIYEGSGLACYAPIILTCDMLLNIGNTTGITNDDSNLGGALCSGFNSPGIWYMYMPTFNSTVTVSTTNANTDFDTYLGVFQGSCDDLTCVGQNDDGGGSLTSLFTFDAVVGEIYFIRVSGFASMMGNFGMTFDCGGGCLDETACNYDVNAPFDNGTCIYGEDCYGCTDSSANNYDPIVVYDNASCVYTTNVVVFYDINGNGTQDWNEPGMANWPIYVGGLQATLYTNAEGHIDVTMPASPFILELVNNTDNWLSTSPTIQTIVVPSATEASFGLAPSTGEAFFVSGPYDGFWDIIHCTEGREDGIYINNTGSVALNGTITMICSEIFIPEADAFGTIPPDVTGPGFAQWNIVDLLPGQNELFSFHIDGPGFDVLGDNFEFLYDLVLYNEFGEEYFNTEYSTSSFVACSYDPNDITATPAGYADPHFILSGERVEYRIRFQNSGNLVAEDIVIIDDLDPAVFDMSSFQPMYGSASFTTCLHDDGTLDFIFEDINLPDSASNEEASHGFVVFAIDLQPGIAPGTVINNYADIFFEQNPAITTNTVFHTIFDCGSFVVPNVPANQCANDAASIDNTQPFVEAYQWQLDGNLMSNESMIDLTGLAVGMHTIQWSVENPLCGTSVDFDLEVLQSPELSVPNDLSVCANTEVVLNAMATEEVSWSNGLPNGSNVVIEESSILTATVAGDNGCSISETWSITVSEGPSNEVVQADGWLMAQDGNAWQWYFNGEMIEGATAANLPINEAGYYSVSITDLQGCSSTSEEILIVSVDGITIAEAAIYPNPLQATSVLILPNGIFDVQLVDAIGRVVATYQGQQHRVNIGAIHLSAGVYYVQLKNETKQFTLKTVVE
jgi:uncharacterized repeat protein (TIGR01451 family)